MTRPVRLADVIDQAVCTSVDTDLFFPEQGRLDVTRAAKKVCQSCPVRLPCLEAALEFGETGVWGGLTEFERRGMAHGSRHYSLELTLAAKATA